MTHPPPRPAGWPNLSDADAWQRRLGHNSVDRRMLDLVGPWFPLPVKPYKPYTASHPRFWVYGNLDLPSWITDGLQADG